MRFPKTATGLGVVAAVFAGSVLTTLAFLLMLSTRIPPTATEAAVFLYTFNAPGVLQEAATPEESSSRYWFLDSGGALTIDNGIGATLQGTLPESDPWQLTYARANPTDTDEGYHPQNIFRLLTRGLWENAREEVYFFIVQDNLSASPNRNVSNGVLLMSRHQDQDTLYYAGVRVDGTAVIKKKYRGIYYTLAQTSVFAGQYDPLRRPNLLPHRVWIGLRLTSVNEPDGSVSITLDMQEEGMPWRRIASARDDGMSSGTPPILAKGAGGIRTDFMDVLFRSFRIVSL